MQHFALSQALAAESETTALRARWETESRAAAAEALWQAGADRTALMQRWAAPDEEETAMLAAAASLARRRLGAPIAAAVLAGSQAGVLLVEGIEDPLALPVNDPAIQLLRDARGGFGGVALRDAALAPQMDDSLLRRAKIDAHALLIVPIRVAGGPVLGALIAAGRCTAAATAQQREELARIAARTAEEAAARGTGGVDPDTGARSLIGLGAAVEREARRRAAGAPAATVAVIALPTAPGAPRQGAGIEETLARIAEDLPMGDDARLADRTLRAAAHEITCALRPSDMIAAAPTPVEGLRMDVALDLPLAPQTHGPTCLALLLPETGGEAARACVERVLAQLAMLELPGEDGRHLCAFAGFAEVGAARSEGKRAALAALERAYDALAEARAELTPVACI